MSNFLMLVKDRLSDGPYRLVYKDNVYGFQSIGSAQRALMFAVSEGYTDLSVVNVHGSVFRCFPCNKPLSQKDSFDRDLEMLSFHYEMKSKLKNLFSK